MAIILAIETATPRCSAALRINGDLVMRSQVGNNIHSQVLLSMIDSLMSEAGFRAQSIDAVAVGQGPGSFTGLRIGVGVAQGIAFGANCPMIGVSSLDALASQAQADGTIVSALDARMNEVYWCEYLKIGPTIERIGDYRVTPPAEVVTSSDTAAVTLVGNAWTVYQDQFKLLDLSNTKAENSVVYPCAIAVLALAEEKFQRKMLYTATEFTPVYVRDDVAKKSTKPLPGRRLV